jgi:hypothetical protein
MSRVWREIDQGRKERVEGAHESYFYCRRRTIGVPGLNSIMNHIFLLQEENNWCTGTQFCNESYFFTAGREQLVYRDPILS